VVSPRGAPARRPAGAARPAPAHKTLQSPPQRGHAPDERSAPLPARQSLRERAAAVTAAHLAGSGRGRASGARVRVCAQDDCPARARARRARKDRWMRARNLWFLPPSHAAPSRATPAPRAPGAHLAGTSFGRARASLPLHIGVYAPSPPRPAPPPPSRFDAFRRRDDGGAAAAAAGAAHSSLAHDAPPAAPRSSGSGDGSGYATPPHAGHGGAARAFAPPAPGASAPPAVPLTDSPRALFGALRAHFQADAARNAPWLLTQQKDNDGWHGHDPLRGDALFGLPSADTGLSFSDEEPVPLPPAARPRRAATPLLRRVAPARSDVSWPPRRDTSPPPQPQQQTPPDDDAAAWGLDDDVHDGAAAGAAAEAEEEMQRELDACFPVGAAHHGVVSGGVAGARSTRRHSAAFAHGAGLASRRASPLHGGGAAAAAVARAGADEAAEEAAAEDDDDADGLACFAVSPQRKRQNAAPAAQAQAQAPPRAPLRPWRF
jgi:hypothetical protein